MGHRHHRVEQLSDQVVLSAPVVFLAEQGVLPFRRNGQADKPAEQQVVLNLIDELPLAAGRFSGIKSASFTLANKVSL